MKLSAEIIRAIASGQHGDPFAVLGPHRDGQGRATIRAFLPEAREVSVVAPGGEPGRTTMKALHPAGFLAATVPEQVADAYRLPSRTTTAMSGSSSTPTSSGRC